jgi:hypothetical protein
MPIYEICSWAVSCFSVCSGYGGVNESSFPQMKYTPILKCSCCGSPRLHAKTTPAAGNAQLIVTHWVDRSITRRSISSVNRNRIWPTSPAPHRAPDNRPAAERACRCTQTRSSASLRPLRAHTAGCPLHRSRLTIHPDVHSRI